MASLEQYGCWNIGVVPHVWSIAPKLLVLVAWMEKEMWTALVPGIHLALLSSHLESWKWRVSP